ncbi:MAG: hypothetical protein U0270_29020 [Labilithrix sp.]
MGNLHRGRKVIVQAFVLGLTLIGIAACSDDDDATPVGEDASVTKDASPDGSSSGAADSSSKDGNVGDVATPSDATPDTSTADQFVADTGTDTGTDSSTPDASADADADAGPVDAAPDAKDASDASFTCGPVLDGGAACNNLTNIGTDVALVATGTTIPTGTGGTPADGRYVLTELKAYTGSPAIGVVASLNQTLVVCGNVVQFVSDNAGKPHRNKTYLLGPTGLPQDSPPLCSDAPANDELHTTSLTATPTSITLYSTSLLLSVTYTKM